MSDETVAAIRALLAQCSPHEQAAIFSELRQRHRIHEFEDVIGAPAEMILEAVHRAPELTRRMLRGVIADAAFRTHVLPALANKGWRDITPTGNFAFDYRLDDGAGAISVQVKLQRSGSGHPVVKKGTPFGFDGDVYIVETQKTRTGRDNKDNKTRPYRYGEFDVLAVSMQPSTGRWDRYMYTLARWLIASANEDEIRTLQPVSMAPGSFWTDDFLEAATWFRSPDDGRRMTIQETAQRQQTR